VQLAWQNQFDGSTGVGRAISATDVTGYFSFGDPANIELLIKVLDFGTAIKVFYGELTNLHFTLTVTDVQTARSRPTATRRATAAASTRAFWARRRARRARRAASWRRSPAAPRAPAGRTPTPSVY